jgi:hypothetical protein
MVASSRRSGRNGAVSAVFRLVLCILLIRRARAESRVHLELNRGGSLITFRSFPNDSKVRLGEYEEWFSRSRFHGGISVANGLYECNVRKLK